MYVVYCTRRDKKNGLRWPRWGCYDGCAEWHAKTRSGMNTYEEQQEWRRLPQRSPREDWTGTGMWWGEMANTYWGKCWGQIYQGKGREDDRKQDGKTRVNEIWKVLDWERARRRTGRCGEERSSVIPATLHDGKSQRKRRRRRKKKLCTVHKSWCFDPKGYIYIGEWSGIQVLRNAFLKEIWHPHPLVTLITLDCRPFLTLLSDNVQCMCFCFIFVEMNFSAFPHFLFTWNLNTFVRAYFMRCWWFVDSEDMLIYAIFMAM